MRIMMMMTIDETSLGQAKGPPLSPEQAEIPGMVNMIIMENMENME